MPRAYPSPLTPLPREERGTGLRTAGRLHLCLLLAALIGLSCFAADVLPGPSIRTVEIYVPYEEFLKVADKPEGTVMSLEEYRALVGASLARTIGIRAADEMLPKQRCTLSDAQYTGSAREHAVRFDANFKLVVAGSEWVRCDLGPPLPGLGRVTLDGKPGWVVVDHGRAWLLVKGEGTHSGTLSFSLPLSKQEDVQSIDGLLLNAGAARMILEVEGRATSGTAGASRPAVAGELPLDTEFDEARNVTRFTLALGAGGKVSLSWKRKQAAQKTSALLLAEEKTAYLMERGTPRFIWHCKVSISRQKVDELEFSEPPGGRVVRLSGTHVHSWNRQDGKLRVLLTTPLIGDLDIYAEGFLSAAEMNFELGSGALVNAQKDTRYVVILEPTDGRVSINLPAEQSPRELSANEIALMLDDPRIQNKFKLSRVYLLQDAGSRIAVTLRLQPVIFDTKAAYSIAIDETRVIARAIISMNVEQGRLYTASFEVPAPWKLAELRERETGRGLSADLAAPPTGNESEKWSLRLNEAASKERPLDIEAIITLRDPTWSEGFLTSQTRAFNFKLPSISETLRTATYLAISAHPSIDVAFAALPDWTTQSVSDLERVGLVDASSAWLRSGLFSERPVKEIALQLTLKKPRGDYEMVTHVFTLEREMWVRTDIRLAVVDRAVEELLITLPKQAIDPLHVATLDLKEVAPGPGGPLNQRRIRFNQAWQGVRMLRVEYRAPLEPDKEMQVPELRLEGNFDSRRTVVFQSTGVVELKISPGPALQLASLEETPDFARPFTMGRSLFAYTLDISTSAATDYGTFQIHLFESSPTLSSIAPDLQLTTVLDASGMARTHAAFLLLYSREQYMSLKLPPGAKLIALSVADQNVRPVETPESAGAGRTLSIPLPPRSNARIELVYEQSRGELGRFGTWEQVAPELVSIPVGETNWKIYYPPSLLLSIKDGNIDSAQKTEPPFFALSFWRRLFSARLPRWTAWETLRSAGAVRLAFAAGAQIETQTHRTAGEAAQLQAVENKVGKDVARERAMGALAIPEGALLQASKLGGSARIVINYYDRSYLRFAARTSFFMALLIGLWLAMYGSRKALMGYIFGGLFLGTLLPPTLDWHSPLFAVPFTEGLSMLAILLLASMIGRALRRRRQLAGTVAAMIVCACLFSAQAQAGDAVIVAYPKDEVKTPDGNPGQRKVYVPKSIFMSLMSLGDPEKKELPFDRPNLEDRKNIALSALGATASHAALFDGNPATAASLPWQTSGASYVITLPQVVQTDRVRILFSSDPQRFLSYKLEISADGVTYKSIAQRGPSRIRGWQSESFRAQGVKSVRLTGTYDSGPAFNVYEMEVLSAPTSIDMAFGNATYELTTDADAYRITGSVELSTFDPKGWVRVALNVAPSQLGSVSIDGEPASITHVGGVPTVLIKGEGNHSLGLEMRGSLMLTPGRAQLEARLVPGAATRLVALLPAGVELDAKKLPAGAWIERVVSGAVQRHEIDLGGSAVSSALTLSWQSPDIRGKGTSQIASRSYTQFRMGAEGYDIFRAERVSIIGTPLDQLSFKLLGDWEIASITAANLSEWSVSGEGEERRLRIWFQKPVNDVSAQISGWAKLSTDAEAQTPGLSLENSVRQEGFIGLQHGESRRFTARSLEKLKRSSQQELGAMFTLPEASLPDRIYHFHQPPAGQLLSVELEQGQVSIETQIVGVIKPERLHASVRSRYIKEGTAARTPLRHEVELPPEWEVRTVRSAAMRDWEIIDAGGKRRLVVHFNTRAATGTEVIWSAERPLQLPATGALTLDLPLFRAIAEAKTLQSVDWVLAADQALELSQAAGNTMQNLALERSPRWVQLDGGDEYHSAFRSSKAESKLVVEVSRRGSVGFATVVSFVRVADDHVQVNARLRFRIEHAGKEQFNLKLPPGATLVSLSTRNLRSRTLTEAADGATLLVTLQSPLRGEQIIDLSYRLAKQPRQSVDVRPILINDPEVRQSEHYVGVLRIERGMITVEPLRGLTKLNAEKRPFKPEELPFLPDNVSASAIGDVYAGEPDWALAVRQRDVKVEVGLEAEISLAVLKTVIAADGGIRSVATYSVRNRALQFLMIAMPEKTTLWGVIVDGQPVTVSYETQGPRNLLRIPIARSSLADLPIEVMLVYESERVKLPATLITVTPQAPEVQKITVVETYWQIFVPEGYEVSRTTGNVKVKEIAGSLLVGGKLKSDISEVERLMKLADSVESSTTRRKALRNVARRQQELNDNAIVLQNTGKSVNLEERKRIGEQDLQEQLSGNDLLLSQAKDWQNKLTARNKDLEEAIAGDSDAEQQRTFMDNYNFLGNSWRRGTNFLKKKEEAAKAPVGEVPADALRSSRPFKGFKPGDLPVPRGPAVTEQKEPLPPGTGLREETLRLNLDKGAADLRVPEKGTQLTFRVVESHPVLSLTLRSRESSWQYGALAMLVLLPVALLVFRRYWKLKR